MNEIHLQRATGEALTDEDLIRAYGRPAAPTLRANFVTSADGAVTLDGFSAGLSGPADKRLFGLLRMLCDGLLVGAGTLRHEGYRPVRLDEPRRAWRREHGLHPYPTLAVVSASLDLDPAAPVFAQAPVRPVVLTGARSVAPPGLDEVVDVVRVGAGFGEAAAEVDPVAGVAELRRRGLDHILCEGGPRLFGTLLAADLVDELCLTVAPVLAGPGAGRIVGGPPSPARTLRLAHALEADGSLLLRYTRAAAR
jgi:riboflavin biosynthesis pyrimidine reductase